MDGFLIFFRLHPFNNLAEQSGEEDPWLECGECSSGILSAKQAAWRRSTAFSRPPDTKDAASAPLVSVQQSMEQLTVVRHRYPPQSTL
jgi:hypothetical protein